MINASHPSPTGDELLATARADFDHAVVIGGSIAGLTAARALAATFARVTVLERDHFREEVQDFDFRSGAPQARHAHMLLPRGQAVLEKLFPGFTGDLLRHGAVAIHPGHDVAVFEDGQWHTAPGGASQISLAASRPLLEHVMRQHLMRNPRVEMRQGQEALGLMVDEQRRRVQGVTIRDRGVLSQRESLSASLVLDASGRGSRAPQWLQQMDFCPPQEWTINAFVGYTTRLYRRPPGFDGDWKALHVRLSPPDHTRGGIILPMEGDRWQVALIGIARDHPPTDEDGFLAFARSLPTPRLYEAIAAAEPLGSPYGYRHTANRMRRYDRMPCYLEGFLVSGDAAYTLNPVYALGMTCAIAAGPALQRALQAHATDLAGLAQTFQRELSDAVAPYWRLATRNDWDWPITEIDDNEVSMELE